MTYKQLSDATGVKLSTTKDWANGSAPRDLSAVRTVAKYFNVSLEYLLFGEEDDRVPKTLDELPTEQIFEGWVKLRIDKPILIERNLKDKIRREK